jgi:hypothetical protein
MGWRRKRGEERIKRIIVGWERDRRSIGIESRQRRQLSIRDSPRELATASLGGRETPARTVSNPIKTHVVIASGFCHPW